MDKTLEQPKTGLGSTAETNRLLGGNYFDTNSGAQVKSYTPTAITSETLSSSSTPVVVPPVNTPTTADAVTGITQSYLDRGKLQKEEQAKALEAQTAQAQEKGKLEGLMEKYLGVQSSRVAEEEKAGIKGLTDTADEYRISLEESQRAQINEIKAVESQGLTDVQRGARVREINRKYAIEQADLQFATDIAERRLDRASRAIDRKIQMQLEPLQTQIEFTKFFYQENKELFTKAEDRAFQAKIKQLDQQYEEEKETRTSIANIQFEAAKNGIILPSNVVAELNRAKTSAEASAVLARNGISLAQNKNQIVGSETTGYYNVVTGPDGRVISTTPISGLGGGSGGGNTIEVPVTDENGNVVTDDNGNPVTEKVPAKKLTADQQKRVDSINSVSAQLKNYRNLVDQYTSGLGAQLTGTEAAELKTAKSALEFAIATAVGTGALQAADRAVVRDLLPDPTSISGSLGSAVRGGKAGNLKAIDQAQAIFDSARSSILVGSSVNISPNNSNSPLKPGDSGQTSSGLKFKITK